MRSLILPFGKAGWEEKIRIINEVISFRPRPPFIYNDVLILVPSSRLKRLYGRLFLDAVERLHGAHALVQPDILTFYQFVQIQFANLPGPRLIDENSRLVLLEGLVNERLAGSRLFQQSPELLAPSLSSVLAKMIEQLSAAGVGPGDLAVKIQGTEFFDKPQVKLLLDVYDRYDKALREAHLTDPAGMRSCLHDHFDPAWLAHYRRIIIDGTLAANKVEANILKKIAASGNCTLLVDAPSADLLKQAGEFHPLTIVKDFLSSLDAIPEQNETAAGFDELYLASAVFSETTFARTAQKSPDPSSFSKEIGLLSANNTREEVSFIAGQVKKSLKSGTVPDSILVAFPALDEYGPLVEELFSDCGIPYNRALGRQLGTSAVATAIISLLRSGQEDFSGPSLLRVFSSPFLKFSENPALAPALDRFMRYSRITGGKQKLLSALKYHGPHEERDMLTGPLNDLFTALEPFSNQEPAPLALWMERLSNLIAWSGISIRVGLIKGPLNVNLQAYKKLNETLASLVRAGKTFPMYRYTFGEWLFLLKKTLMHTRFQVPPEDEGGVQILGLEESQGHPWSEIYLGGLIDGKFPQRLPQNIFLPEQILESMGVRTLERARLNASYHFYRLLLSADKVVLTYPENEGDRPVMLSPFLEELAPLRKGNLLNRGIEKTSGIQFSLKIEHSRSIPELAKAAGMAAHKEQGRGGRFHTEWIDTLAEKMPELAPQLNAMKAAFDYNPGANTVPAVAMPSKRQFWVTELDAYLKCPYDYYIVAVLGIEQLEEVTEDLSPMERGSKVHAILKKFYEQWKEPVTRENRDKARDLLLTLIETAFTGEVETFRNRREKDLMIGVISERFLDAEIEFWKQGMKPAYLEQKIEHYPLILSNGEHVELSGKIDRIDVDGNGDFIIVDYKTGKYPLPKMGEEQEIFQLPVYALMAQQAMSKAGAYGNTPLLRNPVGLAYYDLMGKTGAGARDVVLFNRDAGADHPASKPRASAKNSGEFQLILKQSMDKARKTIEDIVAGNFPTTPHDENKCRYCPNEMMCGKRNEE